MTRRTNLRPAPVPPRKTKVIVEPKPDKSELLSKTKKKPVGFKYLVTITSPEGEPLVRFHAWRPANTYERGSWQIYDLIDQKCETELL